MLRRIGATHLAICGAPYPNRIRSAIFDAIAYGYPVINVTDATSAQTENIANLRNIGGECVTLREFLESFNSH